MKALAFLMLLIVSFLFSSYLLYKYLPGERISLIEVNDGGNNQVIAGSKIQFFQNMRFPSKSISYNYDAKCSGKKIENLNRAFQILQEKTDLEFYRALSGEEIFISCSNLPSDPARRGYFIAGEGGPTKIINTTIYAVIFEGSISLFRDETCPEPNIALHEILHVLGFDHNNDPGSIMYPTLDCRQEIDQEIIDLIDELYSQPSYADLVISNVNASKAGPFLDFSIGVLNQGLVEANGVKLHVYADNKLVQEFDFEDINVGTTKIFTVSKLTINRGVDEIRFVVDQDNRILEIYEDNNDKILRVS